MEVSPNPAHVPCGAEAGPLGDLLHAEVGVFDQVIPQQGAETRQPALSQIGRPQASATLA